jgi:hypothetical protein
MGAFYLLVIIPAPPLRRLPSIFSLIRPVPLPAPLPAPALAIPRVIPATDRSSVTFRSDGLLRPHPALRTLLSFTLRANFRGRKGLRAKYTLVMVIRIANYGRQEPFVRLWYIVLWSVLFYKRVKQEQDYWKEKKMDKLW